MTKQLVSCLFYFAVSASAVAFPARMQAQQGFSESSSLSNPDELPDSPGTTLQAGAPSSSAKLPEPKHRRIIPADRSALPLTTGDKFKLGLKNPLRPSSLGSSLFSAEYSNLRDSSPHFGVDLPAFGERFGAAKLRQTTESFFSYGLYAAAFHDDPRYYVMGPEHKFANRAAYSASRAFITRKDDGSQGINWAKLAGLATSSALTNAYYPPRDRTFDRTMKGYAYSIAGTAGVNELHEFIGDVIGAIKHKRAAKAEGKP
jgi:hypothetical protein